MKRILCLVLCLCMLLPAAAFAERKVITALAAEINPEKLDSVVVNVRIKGYNREARTLALEIIGQDYTATNFYCIPAELNRYTWSKADWWGIPMDKYTDMRFVSQLPETTLQMQVKPVEGGYDVTLTNNSQVIAYQNIVKALDASGQLIPGTFWTDNFFTVLPGESRTVHCTLPQGCTAAEIGFSGWNAKIAE